MNRAGALTLAEQREERWIPQCITRARVAAILGVSSGTFARHFEHRLSAIRLGPKTVRYELMSVLELRSPTPPIELPSDLGVYFVRAAGRVKIGFASSARERMQKLQTSCPFPLEPILFCRGLFQEDERQLHARFADLRVQGEWFDWTSSLVWHVRSARGLEVT